MANGADDNEMKANHADDERAHQWLSAILRDAEALAQGSVFGGVLGGSKWPPKAAERPVRAGRSNPDRPS